MNDIPIWIVICIDEVEDDRYVVGPFKERVDGYLWSFHDSKEKRGDDCRLDDDGESVVMMLNAKGELIYTWETHRLLSI